MRNSDRLIYILGALICVLAFFTTNFIEIPVTIFIVFFTTRNRYTYQVGMLMFGLLIGREVITMDFFGAAFMTFFAFLFHSEWKNIYTLGSKVMLKTMPQQLQNNYAMMFLVFLAIDMLFGYFQMGSDVFKPIVILTVMLSALTFLTGILVCRCFHEAVYFYMGFLALSIISYVYTLYVAFSQSGMLNVVIVALILIAVLKLLICYIFIKENK